MRLDDSPEYFLASRDKQLANVINAQSALWPRVATEDPLWGLLRIVMAQQISTRIACRLAERVKTNYPELATPSPRAFPDVSALRGMGLPERRAQCCVQLIQKSDQIRDKIRRDETWETALAGIKGIGPWTLAVFRIMVLRDPDVLPLGDVGLERAIGTVYGTGRDVERLAEDWRPYRSVACWYLWRTLGNEQLG